MPAFSVSKSIEINAPRERVYEVVRDFKSWPSWSPWLIVEPDCRVDNADDGNSYSWEGKIVGAGGMEILDETAPESISYKLTFLKPWKSVADVRFSFSDADEGKTEVVWEMDSSLPIFMFFMKGMMMTLIGMDYQRGLLMLKDFVETGEVPSKLNFGETEIKGFSYVGIHSSCPISDIGPSMETNFTSLMAWIKKGGIEPTGTPFSIYHKWNMSKGLAEYTAAIPVSEVPADLAIDFVSGKIPDVKCYTVTHTGPYYHLGNAWSAGITHQRAKVFPQSRKVAPFEIYENDPAETSENELITRVNFPIRES